MGMLREREWGLWIQLLCSYVPWHHSFGVIDGLIECLIGMGRHRE